MLTSEEKNAYYYWFILDKIKEALGVKGRKDSFILYTLFLYPALNDSYKPNSTVEQEIISILIDDGVVEEVGKKVDFKIGGDKSSNPESAGFQYLFKVNHLVFDPLYEKYKKLIKRYEVSEDRGNTLYFNINGEVTYVSPTGKEYKATLNINNNAYKLLYCLANRPNEIVSIDDLANSLNNARGHADEATDDSRVISTIKSIKETLNYKEKDLFVSNHGYGIYCKVHIIK